MFISRTESKSHIKSHTTTFSFIPRRCSRKTYCHGVPSNKTRSKFLSTLLGDASYARNYQRIRPGSDLLHMLTYPSFSSPHSYHPPRLTRFQIYHPQIGRFLSSPNAVRCRRYRNFAYACILHRSLALQDRRRAFPPSSSNYRFLRPGSEPLYHRRIYLEKSNGWGCHHNRRARFFCRCRILRPRIVGNTFFLLFRLATYTPVASKASK